MERDLDGKVMLVTGGTEGIGKAACDELAARGATLVLVARNREKGTRVVEELKKASGNDRISLIVADLASLAGVRDAARAFLADHDRLDVLINNAGGLFMKHRTSADGFELTFALNHLAYFLLTNELLPLLKKTKGARIVSTSSGAHGGGKIELDTIAKRQHGSAGFRAYRDSKLANILFTRELARKLEGTGVTANCFHPGFVHTKFANNDGVIVGTVVSIGGVLFGRTPQKGAETLVWLATSPDAAGFSGEYFFDRAPARRSRAARDDEMAARLWTLSERLCGLAN